MARITFNPSNNQYSDALTNYLSQQVQAGQKAQQDQQNAVNQLKIMQKMGLIGGIDPTDSSPAPSIPITPPGPLKPPATASVPAQAQTTPAVQSTPGKKIFPFLQIPKPTGGFSFIRNPDYTSAGKRAQESSISNFDVNSVKTPKTAEDRQAILDSLPGDLATNVQNAGTYKLNSQNLYGLRNNSGDRSKFDALVGKLYPGWNAQGYEARQKYMNNLSSGQLSQNVTSLNTLAHHLGTFEDTMKDMKSQGIPAQNAFVNAVKGITGDPTITDFDTAKEVVDNELQRTLTDVGVTQSGVERAGATINKNSSYQQMNKYIGLLKGIVKGRIEPLREQYKNNMGEEENGQILYPDSKKYFDSDDTSDSADGNAGAGGYQAYLKAIGQ